MERNYTKGLWFNPKHENQPEFVVGGITIDRQALCEWLNEQPVDAKGFIHLDVLFQKADPTKTSVFVNDYKMNKGGTPKAPDPVSSYTQNENDLPF